MAESAHPQEGPLAKSYDDNPFIVDLDSLPKEMAAPLAPFDGEPPPSPQWFKDALAKAPERREVQSNGTNIELLIWGERGRPGLLLVHGNSAHADWWTHIGPYLAEGYRVAAMSLAGMGDSEWREHYSFPLFASDAQACVEAAGLNEANVKPIYVGHSFGGSNVFFAAVNHPDRMRGMILVDCGLTGPPPEVREMMQKRADIARSLPGGGRVGRIYKSRAHALSRFRLSPPQIAGEICVADYIARTGVRETPTPDGGTGWTWKFDPDMWMKLDRSGMEGLGDVRSIRLQVPGVHILGDRSRVIERRVYGDITGPPADLPEILIPDSAHHIMVDQPLALVAAIRAVLATWPS